MKNASRALAALLIAIALPLAGAVQTARAADPLIVGANIGNVPWEFAERGGTFVGFEIDLAKAVGARLDREVEIVNIPFNGLFPAVQSGRVDIAVSSITITPQRLGSVAFAQPYYESAQSLTVLGRSEVRALADLDGRVVGVDTGSTGDMWATREAEALGIGEIRRYEGLAPAMLDLQAMRIDAYLSDIPAMQYYVRDKPFLQVVARIETGERYSMMFARGNPLADEVDAVIGALKRDGVLARLHETWFGAVPAADSATVVVLPRPE
ncbi:MAG TPA: ABC transporter substrate-binding protein [Pseudomonadales bacterium]|nr:ABC transporter substrate-binding protein [Pseudomonadales bacterium]